MPGFRTLTVKELLAALRGVPDDTPLVLSGGRDHSYALCTDAEVVTAAEDANGLYGEWAGHENASANEKPRMVVLLTRGPSPR